MSKLLFSVEVFGPASNTADLICVIFTASAQVLQWFVSISSVIGRVLGP